MLPTIVSIIYSVVVDLQSWRREITDNISNSNNNTDVTPTLTEASVGRERAKGEKGEREGRVGKGEGERG